MAFYRSSGSGGDLKTKTVEVTATDFPDLFKYIDQRASYYTIAAGSVRIVSIDYVIVTKQTYNASSISFYDTLNSQKIFAITKPTTETKPIAMNGLKIYMSSTLADGDLHFEKLSYTYIEED